MTPIEWLLGNDTGVSSKTILAVMTGTPEPRFGPDCPHDADDFGRCYRLLQHFPEWRARLAEVSDRYPIWGPLVEHWAELEAIYFEETQHNVPRTLSARIQALTDHARSDAGWIKLSDSAWFRPTSHTPQPSQARSAP
jgi:hypothetical protein